MIDVLAGFWTAIKRTEPRILMLDFDGTIAPFKASRFEVRPYPGVSERLEALSKRACRIVVISGRPAKSLPSLLGTSIPLEIWGAHGAERLLPDGTFVPPKLSEQTREGLRQAHWQALLSMPPTRIERKSVSVAVHWRGLPLKERVALRKGIEERWRAIANRFGLSMRPFDGGLEIIASGVNKGTAVKTLLEEAGERWIAAYLGDDQTDESGFEVLKGRGLSILVRSRWRITGAEAWIAPPEELLHFLEGWIQWVPPKQP